MEQQHWGGPGVASIYRPHSPTSPRPRRPGRRGLGRDLMVEDTDEATELDHSSSTSLPTPHPMS